MITNVDYVSEEFTYTISSVDTVVTFASVSAENGCISFLSDTTPEFSVTITKKAFLELIPHTPSADRSSDQYEQAKTVYKLVRVIEGESEANAEAEIANLEAQYDALKADKDAINDGNDTAIETWIEHRDANETKALKQTEIDTLELQISQKNEIITGITNGALSESIWDFDRADDILQWKDTYLNLLTTKINLANTLNTINEPAVFTTFKGSAELDILQEDYAELLDAQSQLFQDFYALDPESPSYAFDKESLEQSINLNIKYVAEKKAALLSELADNIATNQTANAEAITDLLAVFSDALAAQLVTDASTLADLEDEYDALPSYDEEPEVPEKTEITMPISRMMKKMIFVANDDTWPDVTLANVTVEDVEEYEVANGTIIIN